MSNRKVHDNPSAVEARADGVHVEGPDDVSVVLTPRAALETARRLGDAAVEMLIGHPESQPKGSR